MMEFEPCDNPFIHHRACVDVTCKLGWRTRVYQFASVIRHSVVGEHCSIASSAIIDGAVLGDRVIIGHGAFVGPGMVLEDDVFVGPTACFCNDTWPRTEKRGFNLDALVEHKLVVTRVQQGASVGAGAIILPGVVIGSRAMIAAGAVVIDDVPAGYLLRRNGDLDWISDQYEQHKVLTRMHWVEPKPMVGA